MAGVLRRIEGTVGDSKALDNYNPDAEETPRNRYAPTIRHEMPTDEEAQGS